MPRTVFVTGSTGYLGRPLIASLLERGHRVRALARPESISRIPIGADAVTGNALDSTGWQSLIAPAETFVHLIGTPHPNPRKAAEFQSIDLVSIRTAVDAARAAGIRHFVYVSVAHPAPVMHAFIAVRQEGERLIRSSGIPATILRPWYVLGPGHRWAYALAPVYALARLLPSTRVGAERLALIPYRAMIASLVNAVESEPMGVRIMEGGELARGGNAAA
jgi:uncharacterized protein YbjT (DUF2867 family)